MITSSLFIDFFQFAELSNLKTHLILRSLRPEGTTKRAIPQGYGFNWVSCPNYFFETIAWFSISMMTGSLASTWLSSRWMLLLIPFQPGSSLLSAHARCSLGRLRNTRTTRRNSAMSIRKGERSCSRLSTDFLSYWYNDSSRVSYNMNFILKSGIYESY